MIAILPINLSEHLEIAMNEYHKKKVNKPTSKTYKINGKEFHNKAAISEYYNAGIYKVNTWIKKGVTDTGDSVRVKIKIN